MFAGFAALSLAAPAPAQPTAALPSPAEYLGYDLGTRFTHHQDALEYLRELAGRSDRILYSTYGETPEGRPLVHVTIASAANLARLDDILERNAQLTRPGTSAPTLRDIESTNPAIVYFSFGIHGDEASSTEAALWLAHDLLSDSRAVAGVLDSLVVVIDPVVNPDGRERYVQWYRSVVGATPDADPQTREHRQPWPGGRYNHYTIDLNRDWAWATQPETRARLAAWSRLNPQVHVDFHEMEPESSYFFFPAADPINPIYPEPVREWWQRFGRANASAFDARGWPYFTAESFDMLYPGYGDTWPTLQGAIGMTYEQGGGGSAGLAYARNGDTLTLAMRIERHRESAAATLRTAAANRARLLQDFVTANRSAGEGEADFLLVPGATTERLDSLVAHLLVQGIEMERAPADFRTSATPYAGYSARNQFPAGTIIVRARQPRGRLATTLLQQQTELNADYSYDISAWSLLYAYGVEAHRARGAPGGTPVTSVPPSDGAPGSPVSGAYAYLVPPTDAGARGIINFLARGNTARVLARPVTMARTSWPAGTWLIPNRPDADMAAELAAAGLGPRATAVAGGFTDAGVDFGSGNVHDVRLPRVALLAGDGVVPWSFGAHWYHLEVQLGLDAEVLELPDLPELDLTPYDVIVLPEIDGDDLPNDLTDPLQAWVEGGGHLIAVGSGAIAVASIGGAAARSMESEDAEDETEALDRLLETREQRERRAWREEVPGAILPVRVDTGHPFAWGASHDGLDDRLFVLQLGGRSFEPMEGAEAVASFGPELQAVSGVIAPEILQRLERSAWLLTARIGRGQLTLFADDPVFRLFWRSTMPLYRNALLYGGM